MDILDDTTHIGPMAPASAFDRINKAVTTVDKVFDQVLEELAWMDIPVLVLPTYHVNVYPDTPTMRHAGALMHVIHGWDTHVNRWSDDHKLEAITADSSRFTPGKVEKHNGHRMELIGEYRILGIRDKQVYLAPVQPDIDTVRVREIQQTIEAQYAARRAVNA